MSRKIITCFERPPVADRFLDWSATLDDYEGASCPIGHGATEREAVMNLLDLLTDEQWLQVWNGWIERV